MLSLCGARCVFVKLIMTLRRSHIMMLQFVLVKCRALGVTEATIASKLLLHFKERLQCLLFLKRLVIHLI